MIVKQHVIGHGLIPVDRAICREASAGDLDMDNRGTWEGQLDGVSYLGTGTSSFHNGFQCAFMLYQDWPV